MLLKELVNKKTEDLLKLEEEARAELFALRFQASVGNLEKPHRISELRKTIARILTILSERKAKGENTNINVKVDLKETIKKVEADAKVFAKKRRAEYEKMMAEQQGQETDFASQLNDLDLSAAMADANDDNVVDTTAEEVKPAKKTVAKKGESK